MTEDIKTNAPNFSSNNFRSEELFLRCECFGEGFYIIKDYDDKNFINYTFVRFHIDSFNDLSFFKKIKYIYNFLKNSFNK